MYNRSLREINKFTINHKLSLTKIKSKTGVKAICFAEEPFIFRIKNFSIKDFNRYGFISIFTKNNLHQKLNSLYQIFSEIESQVINVIFENRFQWCNGMNIPRYQFEEAFHQPIKIKNNETIISCHYENSSDPTFQKLLMDICDHKKLVSFVVEYEGFELSESDIFPLFKITEIKERETKFSQELFENSSSEENTEVDIYPTDIESQPEKQRKKTSEIKCADNNIESANNIPEANNKVSNDESNTQVLCENLSENIDSISFMRSESETNDYDNDDVNDIKLNANKKYENLYKNFRSEIQNMITDNNLNLNQKKKNKNSLASSPNYYVSKVEFQKIRNSKELSSMLKETVDLGYESQFEKVNKIKIKL